jgi:hypothetical protein
VVDGNVKLVLALMWVIMGHFATVKLNLDSGVDLPTLRKRLQHWLLTYSVAPPGSSAFDSVNGEAPYEVPNLNRALQDGKVLLAVLHHFNPAKAPPAQERACGDGAVDLGAALEELWNEHAVEKLLDPSTKLDDKFTVPYLIEMVGKLHEKFGGETEDGSSGVVKGCRPLTDPFLDEPPECDASAAALKAAEVELAAQALSKEAAEEDNVVLTSKVKVLELDKEKLEALVAQLEDEVCKAKADLAGADTRARKASVQAVSSPKSGQSGSSSSSSSNGGDDWAPPPLPTSAPPPPPGGAPPPIPTSVPPPVPPPPRGAGGVDNGGDVDARLEMMEQQHEAALIVALGEAEEKFAEIESRHVARTDDLESRLLAVFPS